jgi:hypothetical protein
MLQDVAFSSTEETKRSKTRTPPKKIKKDFEARFIKSTRTV